MHNNLPELARKAGFKLLCDGALNQSDLETIAYVSIDELIKGENFEKLHDCASILINNPVEKFSEHSTAFTISHYCLQYFSFCTKFLDGTVHNLEEKLKVYQTTLNKCKQMVVERDAKIKVLEQKLKRCISVLYPCPKCSKVYESQVYLDGHMARRHSKMEENKQKDEKILNEIKFEIEIRQLKECLVAKEKELSELKNEKITRHVEIQTERENPTPEVAAIVSQEVNSNLQVLIDEKLRALEDIKIINATDIKSFIEKKFDDSKDHQKEVHKSVEKLDADIQRMMTQINDENSKDILREITRELEDTYQKTHAEMNRNFQDVKSLYSEKLCETEEKLLKYINNFKTIRLSTSTQTEDIENIKPIKKTFSGQKFYLPLMKSSKSKLPC